MFQAVTSVATTCTDEVAKASAPLEAIPSFADEWVVTATHKAGHGSRGASSSAEATVCCMPY